MTASSAIDRMELLMEVQVPLMTCANQSACACCHFTTFFTYNTGHTQLGSLYDDLLVPTMQAGDLPTVAVTVHSNMQDTKAAEHCECRDM